MTYDPDIHHRRSVRKTGCDYSQPGLYFVTICTHNKRCHFGHIFGDQVRLTPLGQIVTRCWQNIPSHFPHSTLDSYVVMPNHIHGIIRLTPPDPYPTDPSIPLGYEQPKRGTAKTVGSIVRGMKFGVMKWVRENTGIQRLWQASFYERIIRDEKELIETRRYISNNPIQWAIDKENPNR